MTAQVSGPGALSQRTDTGGQPIRKLPNADYGEGQAYVDVQKGAPLADSATTAQPQGPYPSDIARDAGRAASPAPAAPAPGPALPGLFDQGDPAMPVTAGAALGPGANTVTGGDMPRPAYSISSQLMEYAGGDGDSNIAWLANTLAKMGH